MATGDSTKTKSFPQNPNWMSKLPDHLHDTPLNQLAIPGSHDSACFEFDKNGGIGPDSDQLVKILEKLFGPMINGILYRWAKTQHMNFTQQLSAGIRYLDLRVSTRQGYPDLYLLHSLYADKVCNCLNDIDIYLDTHSKEIVILDFNHFYAMTEIIHKQLISMIVEIFGHKMCPLVDMDSLTLNMLWENKLQVIVIYHDVIASENHQLWPGRCIRSPWANTVDVNYLLQYLDNIYESGHSKDIFLSYQCVLTADTGYVVAHLSESLIECLSQKATSGSVKWLANKAAGSNKLNICIADVIDNYNFISTVIAKNN